MNKCLFGLSGAFLVAVLLASVLTGRTEGTPPALLGEKTGTRIFKAASEVFDSLSEDMRDYIHSHPFEGPDSDVSKGAGGPNVTFEGYMPKAGRYRAWSQFQRNGEVITVPFTVNVSTIEEAVRGASPADLR